MGGIPEIVKVLLAPAISLVLAKVIETGTKPIENESWRDSILVLYHDAYVQAKLQIPHLKLPTNEQAIKWVYTETTRQRSVAGIGIIRPHTTGKIGQKRGLLGEENSNGSKRTKERKEADVIDIIKVVKSKFWDMHNRSIRKG